MAKKNFNRDPVPKANKGPYGYEKMFEIVMELDKSSDITDTLEIGCGGAGFVEFMRENGFNSYGIDIDESELDGDGMRKGYLIHLNGGALAHHFKDKKFDLILANSVMSYEATRVGMAHRYGLESEKVPESLRTGITGQVADFNPRAILESSLNQLRPKGYFVSVNNEWAYHGPETGTITEELAENIGYKTILFNPTDIVLQKP